LLADSLAKASVKQKDESGEIELIKALLIQERRTYRLLVGALLFGGGFLVGI
jgi:ubiquinone biosynthesis protein